MSDNGDFTCLTCSTSHNQDQISKHLSSSRHKNVKVNNPEETIECEECRDSNIHQLAILRYGFNDMSLLCQKCLDKEKIEHNETPSATYTLSNGAFFSKLSQYLTFRDLSCCICSNDENLSVATVKPDEPPVVVCQKCISSFDSTIKFVSEDDSTFLSELFGIKEIPNKNLKKSKRGGRRGKSGKGGRKGSGKRGKKPDPEADERRAHYMASKQLASTIKAGTTVKAIGSTTLVGKKNESKDIPSKGKNSQRGAGGKKISNRESPSGRHTPIGKSPSNSGRQTPIGKSPSNSGRQTPLGKSPSNSGKSTPVSRSQTPVIGEGWGIDDNKSEKPGREKKPNEKPKEAKKVSPKSGKKQNNKKASGKSTPVRIPTPVIADGWTQEEENGIYDQQTDDTSQTPVTFDGWGVEEESDSGKKQGSKSKDNKKSSEPSKKSKDRSKSPEPVPSGNELILPPSIFKYHPATKPKLSYHTLQEYYREMSFNMFLEDQLTNVSNIIESEFIMIEWYEDQDKKNTQYKLSIQSDSPIVDNFRSDIFKKLKKNPFQIGQSIFLILNDEIPWYGGISYVDEVSSNPRSRKKDIIEMVVTLYNWNNQPLPKTIHSQHLKVMPASVPVSRVLNSMNTLSNPNFIKMVLGNEPIKQISFKNFLKYSRDTLNDSQKQAIQSVLNNAITVLQGPPGTGKTSTIFEIILQLVDSLNTYPILVVAPSNIAIDNIAEKLMVSHENHLLRVVATEKEREYNRNHHLSSICLHSKVYDGLSPRSQVILDEIKRGKSTVGKTGYKKFTQERFQVTKKMVQQAKVIFTTTVVAGSGQLKSIGKFPIVIMDEATQSSEPTTLIPLSVPGVDKFVFVGDQKQLNCFSLVPGLSVSLFERILLNGSCKTPHMLDTQYRMHPAISEFARNKFYGGLLKDGISEEDRKMEGIPENPVYFWNTNGKSREQSVQNWLREDRGFTYTNPGEIDYVIQVVKNLIIEKGIKREDIGIITPYSGQRDLISSILVRDDIINPQNEDLIVEVDIDDIKNDSKPVTIHIVSGILIASIDAFQGREKNFMVMSCVRSNEEGKIGFLRDERRLNVALTRAKYGMILIGDESCLRRGDKLWNSYMNHLKDKNSIHSSDTFTY
ncbi:putative ATP-dependent RNA helicase ECM32 [Spathaspora sp. JA1]|nr:putative ATP-dependent RNA helicase ECM32 [Spathaspora sp. JA1]